MPPARIEISAPGFNFEVQTDFRPIVEYRYGENLPVVVPPRIHFCVVLIDLVTLLPVNEIDLPISSVVAELDMFT